MNYLAWALFAEGTTDVRYLETLLPRVVLQLVQGANGPAAMVPDSPVAIFGVACRDIDQAAGEICQAKEAFQLLFVHGDTGSPAQEQYLGNRTCALCDRVANECEVNRSRCVIVAPRRETESWCLADKAAIRDACGVSSRFDLSFVPDSGNAIESVADPKALMNRIQDSILSGRRRRPAIPYASLGQMQDLMLLRGLPSFRAFEAELKGALRTLGYPELA